MDAAKKATKTLEELPSTSGYRSNSKKHNRNSEEGGSIFISGLQGGLGGGGWILAEQWKVELFPVRVGGRSLQ